MEKFPKFSILFSVLLLPLNQKPLTPGLKAHFQADLKAVFCVKNEENLQNFQKSPFINNIKLPSGGLSTGGL